MRAAVTTVTTVADSGSGRSIGERLVDVIAEDRARGPGGDHGSGDAIIRHYELIRASRLMASGRTLEGLRGLLRASGAPASLLAKLTLTQRRAHALPVVRQPGRFLDSADDAAHELAAALWSLQQREAARALLKSRAASHDWRALLQLAWLLATDGALVGARRARRHFLNAAPHLHREAWPLNAQLDEN